MRYGLLKCLLIAALAAPLAVGCKSKSKTGEKTGQPAGDAHPEKGPHGGELIELGNEEYHGELLHKGDKVTIYILDGGAKKTVPIDAKEVTINIDHFGSPEQFKLAAKPDEGDPAGKSSRFESTDAHLSGHIDEEDTNPKLVVTIKGKQYQGEIEHHHEGGGKKHVHKTGESHKTEEKTGKTEAKTKTKTE